MPHTPESILTQPRIVLGLLGGVGSGKSYVAGRIAALAGAEVVDADRLARAVLDQTARDGRLAREMGPEAVGAGGLPDRAALARRVFADGAARRRLARLVHPTVLAEVLDRLRAHREGTGRDLLVLDVPLLLEAGLDRHCTELWFVDAPLALRRARALARGIPEVEAGRREDCQTPLERKRARADFVLVNDGNVEPRIREGLQHLGLSVTTL